MITILFRPNNQTIFHAFYPIIASKYSREFYFTTDLNYCLKKDSNKSLVLVSFFKLRYQLIAENITLLKQLKQQYDKVVFFDDSDGADSLHVELIEHVDLYFKKQLLKNTQKYLTPSYGRQQFSDYYHNQFNISDKQENIRETLNDERQLEKLHLSWNIGAAIYPSSRIQRKIFNYFHQLINFNLLISIYNSKEIVQNTLSTLPRKNVIQARFGFGNYTASIGHQRKLLIEAISDSTGFTKGRISRGEFYKEMQNVKAVLSPFGWGEICHRDFEAIIYGCALLKPDMEHVDTFPQIYIKNETYLPIKWDASDALLRSNEILNDSDLFERLNKNAREVYYTSINNLDQRVLYFINTITAS